MKKQGDEAQTDASKMCLYMKGTPIPEAEKGDRCECGGVGANVRQTERAWNETAGMRKEELTVVLRR
jgi:hypothetical protein